MSEPSIGQGKKFPIPLENNMDSITSSSDNLALDCNPLLGCNANVMSPSNDNENELFSSEALDIFEAVTDTSSHGRPSPSLRQQQETGCLDFGELSLPPEDVSMPLEASTFHYKDDTCGVIPMEDENEEYCAELAERWVEEQIHREDLLCMGVPGNSSCDSYHLCSALSAPASAMSSDSVTAQDCLRTKPTPCKRPGAIPSSLNPITPVQPNVSLPKFEYKRMPKRSAREMSNLPFTQKSGKRRNAKNQAHSPNIRSESRIRMDNALNERYEAQMALREALKNLKKARILERECRARYVSANDLVETTAENECEALLREETPWNSMFHQLKKYKDETGGCNLKQVEDNKSPEMARLAAWIGKNRKDCKLNGKSSHLKNKVSLTPFPKAASVTSPQQDKSAGTVVVPHPCSASNDIKDLAREEHDDTSVFEDLDHDSILADPYKKIALDRIGFDYDPRTSRWNEMYKQLKDFKAVNGTCLVPHANFGLGSWVKRQQVQYNLYSSGSKSELTEDRVRMLNDLGFVWSRRSNNWNENFQRLKRWSEEHGTCHIPDGSDDPELVALSKWISDQRAHFKRLSTEDENENYATDENVTKRKIKKKVTKLCPEKIEALKSIGFEFDARDAKWLQKFDLLIEYKKKHGDFLVPSNYRDDPTLSNWVASQRQQYKLYQKGGKSHMTQRRLKILSEAGFPFSSKEELQKKKDEATQQDIDDFEAKPWIEKYKDLLLHISKHGSVDLLQKSNSLLWDWIVKQREELYLSGFDSDISDTAASTNGDRVALMKVADAFASYRIVEGSVDVTCSSATKDNQSWDSQFGSLAAWYIKYGTYSNKGMPTKLKKFMGKQQEQYYRLHSEINSELTQDRIEKLNDIYFPFHKTNLSESIGNDATASRRKRSWEEYRLDLAISYIRKGNYDMQAIDDIELRRWATEQKRQHKLYLSGKQSSLCFTQIQRLIDIKFISKRPKQWSWPELCGDLMAFRIQFGTFDIASANIVISPKCTPKNKTMNLGSITTAFHNVQDFVSKLKSSKDEFTQEQLLKLNSANFPWDEATGSSISSVVAKSSTQNIAPAEQQVSFKPITKHIFGMVLAVQSKQ